MKGYRFDAGDKVRISVGRSASAGALEHNGEVVTIKRRCPFTWAYEVEEIKGSLFTDGCFEAERRE